MRRLAVIAAFLCHAPLAQAQVFVYPVTFYQEVAAAVAVLFAPTAAHPGYYNIPSFWDIDRMNPVADHPLNEGLVSWWFPEMHDGGGSTLPDLVSGNDATLDNMDPATDWVTYYRGRVLSYDASNDNLDVPNESDYDLSVVTISVWACPSNASTDVRMINKPGDSFYYQPPFALVQTSVPSWQLAWYTTTYEEVNSTTVPSTSECHHIVGTINGSTDAYLYVNGTQEGSDLTIGTASMSNQALVIGAGTDAGTTEPFGGELGSIRIYNRVLSPREVRALYLEAIRGYPNTLNYIDQ